MGRICTLPPIEGDPQPEAAWRLYYRDTFDRACPPGLEVEGTGLARGLMELGARYLGEEATP